MTKCSLSGCENPVIGGFKEIIDAGNFDNPHATIEGMKTLWCKEHKNWLSDDLYGKRGKFLSVIELTD